MSDVRPDESSDASLEVIRKMLDSRPREALRLSLEIVGKALEQENSRLQAEGRVNAGWAYHYLGEPSSSMTEFLRSLQIFKALGENEGFARALHGLGTLHHRLGDLEISTENYTQLLLHSQKHKLTPWEFAAYNRLGELNLDLGRTEQAKEFLESAKSLLKKKGSPAQNYLLRLNFCFLELTRGEYGTALRHLVKVVDQLRKAGEKRHLSHALHLLGRSLTGLGRHEEAQIHYHEALGMMLELENSSGKVKVLLELSKNHLARAEIGLAESTCKEAVEISRGLGLRIEEAQACRLYAEITEVLGKTQESLNLYKRYIGISEILQNETISRRLANLNLHFQLNNSERKSLALKEVNRKLEFQKEELSTTNERVSYINEVAQELVGTLDASELSRRFCLILNTLMPLATIGFGLFDPIEGVLDFFHWEKKGKRRFPAKMAYIPTGNLPSQVLQEQREIILPWEPTRPAILSPGGIQQVWIFPLGAEETFSGLVVLESAKPDCFNTDTNLFVRTLSRYYAASLQNSLKHREILRLNEVILNEKKEIALAGVKAEYLAHHDSLTGAANRLMLGALVNNAIAQCTRRKEKFALIYVDLDQFKPINDQYGHAVGDEVLKAVTNVINRAVRESDTLARVGGDEFVTLLNPVQSRNAAEKVADNILKAIQEPISTTRGSLSLNASMGISLFPDDGATLDDLLGVADREMYTMKKKRI